jgi:hypothetical protein
VVFYCLYRLIFNQICIFFPFLFYVRISYLLSEILSALLLGHFVELWFMLFCPFFIVLQVVVVDLEYNRICTSEEIPPIPEPELSTLRGEILKLLYPNVMGIDQMKAGLVSSSELYFKGCNKPWGEDHDLQLR